MNPDSPTDAKRVLRETVERFIEENPDITNPRIYVLPDAGLLVEVKNQK